MFSSAFKLTSAPRIGLVHLAEGTVNFAENQVPTVTDNVFSQGTISTESIGIYYIPTTTGLYYVY